jgi:branched-subunit amino acid aminotransferase/4-amino-4-deoxychorismate lyase
MLVTPPTNVEMRDASVAAQTAYPKSAVLPGITRAAVMDLAREAKIGIKLASITVEDLLAADEVFLTNSIMQVMPVCRIERKPIGNDKPGPITLKLMSAYAEMVASAQA